MKKTAIRKFFSGTTISNTLPLLNIVAIQQGLNLSKVREYNIAKNVLINSIINN